ncbi:uncharacterized protein LOC123707245 [Pieris brassicae]|uniref:Uncharacterized protein n=1 Tax=Pieris brassicae TaxID=7116 RepID=A0A9P0T936_PIEBR|nr:uncharacterized protein LOC123707245 [Pieris brassicae]CAH4012076.1 unnamed protein product [Pieris brassicae]
MDLQVISDKTKIREIEDVIEIQKASGNINTRQVSFLLPSDTESTLSANVAKSLDSGLSRSKCELQRSKKLQKKIKSCRTLLPDVVSWPSDSDITVLRMKMRLDHNINNNTSIPGDGLHQANSSSMVNLATLMLQSPQHSKHSIHEEMLFPLSSWEGSEVKKECKSPSYSYQSTLLMASCSQIEGNNFLKANKCNDLDTKSKIARFFRLYFCPCCSCLYNIEKLRDESTYISKNSV